MQTIIGLSLQGIAHSIFWLAGFFAASELMKHSEASIAYGYLTGWWTALYLGYVCNFKFGSSVSALVLYFLSGILAIHFRWPWFYKDLPQSVTLQFMYLLFIGGAVFVSPILINETVKAFAKRLMK